MNSNELCDMNMSIKMADRSVPMWRTLLLVVATVFSGMTTDLLSQISHGGSPWFQGDRPEALTMPSFDYDALSAEDEVTDRYKEAPWRFGIEHSVNLNAVEHGNWTEEQDHRVWRLVLSSIDATSLSLRFDVFKVPKGGQLFVYAADGSEVLGSFDHRNMKDWGGLAIGVVATDNLVIEYRQSLNVSGMPELSIDQVVHGYRPLSGWPHAKIAGPFGNSGACHVNVNCPEGALWETEKGSVALIVQGGFAVCTGALVNNTLNDGTPYFLTANHCLGDPGNWVYYFNHESASCEGSSGPTNQSISGGTLLVNSNQSDFALVELSQTPPEDFNVQYAGWDATGAVPESAVGIHHPSGDVKKICFEEDSPSQEVAAGAAVWYVANWELGVTEGGSSGSPLFDQNHRIVGQLFGGSSACAGNVNNGQPDWYGRFDVSWGQGLQQYLDPEGTGIEVWDGFPDAVVNFQNDVAVSIAGVPDQPLCGLEEVFLQLTIANMGADSLTSCVVEYIINGGEVQELSWVGNLGQFENITVSLPAFLPQGGTNTVEVFVSSPNGLMDENELNNSDVAEFTAYQGPNYNYNLTLVLDDYGSETFWTLKRLGQTLYEGGPYQDGIDGEVVMVDFCLEEGCYIFQITDSYEDGICCDYGSGSWSISDPYGGAVGSGGAFGASQQIQFCVDGIFAGCTDEGACNFNSAATEDDGSCDYSCLGCTDSDAVNWEEGATIDDGSCVFFETTCDYIGSESWDSLGAGLFSDSALWHVVGEESFGNWVLSMPTVVEEPSSGSLFAVEAWTELTISGMPNGLQASGLPSMLSGGEQVCLGYAGIPTLAGTYAVEVSGNLTVDLFGSPVETGVFGVQATIDILPNPNPVFGCTYSNAANFLPFANEDDGSCQFPGCTSETATNYQSLATVDDGSCEYEDCTSACPSDIDSDGVVGTGDLLSFLSSFGLECN